MTVNREPVRPIPVIGAPKVKGVSCAACHDTGFYWDNGGHGAYDWKRSCNYCDRSGGPR